MLPLDVLNRSFSTKLIASTVLIILIGALVSAAFFYSSVDQAMGETYDQKLMMLSLYKFEVIRQSSFIFAGFALAALIAVSVFGVVYTHKIVGPLVRTRIVARELAEGNFDVKVNFREGDAIQPLAATLTRFAQTYGGRYEMISNSAHDMYRNANELKELIQKGNLEGAAEARARIAERVDELSRVLGNIRV
jgi:methyl-accepting chemotaxis protein